MGVTVKQREVIRIRILKNNRQWPKEKKNKWTNNDLQNIHIKLKIETNNDLQNIHIKLKIETNNDL